MERDLPGRPTMLSTERVGAILGLGRFQAGHRIDSAALRKTRATTILTDVVVRLCRSESVPRSLVRDFGHPIMDYWGVALTPVGAAGGAGAA